jgi:hypothetical protein
MQLWIYFQAGAGGDGIANLIERTESFVPIDHDDKSHWRVHRWINGQPKFWAPTVDHLSCFRYPLQPFVYSNNSLNDTYVQNIKNNTNTIITSHDVWLWFLDKSDAQDIFLQDRITVYLDADLTQAMYNSAVKNLSPIIRPAKVLAVPLERFDYVVDAVKFNQDWDYANSVCSSFGVALDRQDYLDYQQVLAGCYDLAPFCTEQWQAQVHDNQIKYTKI